MTVGNVSPDALTAAVGRQGFCFVDGPVMRGLLAATGPLDDWTQFAASWHSLAPDDYLAAKGRQRRRRHAVYTFASGRLERAPHQPHFQTLEYNALQGDIERWFEPVLRDVGESATLRTILTFAVACLAPLAPRIREWHLEVHQFRIEASLGQDGEPTPEGVHRDGVDYVLVLMIDRRNIASGTTTIHDPSGSTLGSFTLAAPLDAALVDDHRVYHGVTPVTPIDTSKPAHRDVLVVTLRARQAS